MLRSKKGGFFYNLQIKTCYNEIQKSFQTVRMCVLCCALEVMHSSFPKQRVQHGAKLCNRVERVVCGEERNTQESLFPLFDGRNEVVPLRKEATHPSSWLAASLPFCCRVAALQQDLADLPGGL